MEEKKEPIKIRLSTVILVFIIFILILAIGGMYVYYNAEISNGRVSENENTIEIDRKENNEGLVSSELNELDINSDLVQELYKYILKDNESVEKIAYQNQKITVNNLSNIAKLRTIFENIDDSEADETKTIQVSGMETTHYYFNKETIENKAKKIFGEDVKINHETLPNLLAREIIFKDGKYDKYYIQGGGGFLWEDSTQKLQKAEQKNNEIYLYDKYIHVVRDENNYELNNVYNASDRKRLLESKLPLLSIDIDTIKNVNTYKHTFKKDNIGNYYWVSTEICK